MLGVLLTSVALYTTTGYLAAYGYPMQHAISSNVSVLPMAASIAALLIIAVRGVLVWATSYKRTTSASKDLRGNRRIMKFRAETGNLRFITRKWFWRTHSVLSQACTKLTHAQCVTPSVYTLVKAETLDVVTEQRCIDHKYAFLHANNAPIVIPFAAAHAEYLRRQSDSGLVNAVLEYLGGSLPPSFEHTPVLHLARHVATPNYETLLFAQKAHLPGFATTIGIDSSDLFVPNNPLKHALGKMSFVRSSHGNEFEYRKRTVIDFNEYSGKPLSSVQTLWGENLVDFHTSLLRRMVPASLVQLHDDAPWIDTHGRGDLLEHYKRLLSLFVVHGILFEEYLTDDASELDFDHNVLLPAFTHVERMFGLKPLIVPLYVHSTYQDSFWCSYPPSLLPVINRRLDE